MWKNTALIYWFIDYDVEVGKLPCKIENFLSKFNTIGIVLNTSK